jgi:hypothetical protein
MSLFARRQPKPPDAPTARDWLAEVRERREALAKRCGTDTSPVPLYVHPSEARASYDDWCQLLYKAIDALEKRIADLERSKEQHS